MIDVTVEGEVRIERRNAGTGAEGRSDDAAIARGGGPARTASSTRSGSGRAETTLRGLSDLGIDTVGSGTRFGALDIGLGDREVIAEVGQIEIVLNGYRDRVAQRNINLAIADKVLQARRIAKVQLRRSAGHVGKKRVV